jgi:hypothetical protein
MNLISKVREAWTSIRGDGETSQRRSDPTAEKLSRLLCSCPLCRSALTDHYFSLFATTILDGGGKKRLTEVLEKFQEHRWDDLSEYSDWDSSTDDLEIYAIRCPTNRVALAIIRSPTELYEPERLIHCEILDSEESGKVSALIEESNWRKFF